MFLNRIKLMKDFIGTKIIGQFENFWKLEKGSKPCIAVTAPKKYPQPGFAKPVPPEDIENRWLDREYRYSLETWQFENTFFGGCAFPYTFSNLGPGVISACIGSEAVFDNDTVWFDTDPIIKDWNNPRN